MESKFEDKTPSKTPTYKHTNSFERIDLKLKMPLKSLSALKQLLRGLFPTVKFQGGGTFDVIIMVRKGTAYILN